jgi:epoxyqueuosine reductase
MGNHIYGCDDCQMVCPWNQKVDNPTDDFLAMNKENILPELVSLLRLDDAAFRERFRKSPIKRTGRAAFLRNICITMGNSGNLSFVPQLLRVLQDDEPLIRGHAVWALGQLYKQRPDSDILQGVKDLSVIERDDDVLKEIQAVLA